MHFDFESDLIFFIKKDYNFSIADIIYEENILYVSSDISNHMI